MIQCKSSLVMGQTLSDPITKKHTSLVKGGIFEVGSSSMQGWRLNMEDEHIVLLKCPGDSEAAFFGVFDGHGGRLAADYAKKHLCRNILNRPEYKSGHMRKAIEGGFLQTDKEMSCNKEVREEQSGTTANIIIVRHGRLYCGNCGDSRSLAVVRGEVIPLSFDHKPNNTKELNRITAAGGWVDYGRVKGNLALSRALGDFTFKQNAEIRPEDQMVTALPDVIEKPLSRDWEFIVTACDGIWDVMSNGEVADFVKFRLKTGQKPHVICEELLSRCLSPECSIGGIGCDNMTVILTVFHHFADVT